jgi:predicted alpha/beta superfamily hydrolase
MKTSLLRGLFVILWLNLLPNVPAYSQYPPVTIPNTELRTIHSDLLGQDLALYIRLPVSYQGEPDSIYKVLFFIDANRNFPMVANIISIYDLQGEGCMDVLLVGIGYIVHDMAEYGAWRTRDLTPTNVPSQDSGLIHLVRSSDLKMEIHSGGAKNFLDCIMREIIPFVESNYRVSSTDRGLGGYSLGGLFTMYALFKHPEAFNRYLAGSPSLYYDNRVMFQYEDQYAVRHKNLKAKVFISAGSLEGETMTGNAWKMAEILKSRKYPGLQIEYKNFPDETHASCYPSAIMRGLRYLYNTK